MSLRALAFDGGHRIMDEVRDRDVPLDGRPIPGSRRFTRSTPSDLGHLEMAASFDHRKDRATPTGDDAAPLASFHWQRP